MNKSTGGLFRTIATRAVIAVIPAAMVSAYASGIFVSPPRMAAYEFVPVAEIVVAPNTIGVAESPLYGMTQQQINDQLDQLQAIGVQSIRVFVPWGLIEQNQGAPDWTLLDRIMSAAAARNMGVMAEINATPGWAAPDPANPNGFPFPGSDTPNTAAFVNFVKEFTAHQVNGTGPTYASIVSAYEIWNEPNFAQFSYPIDPEAYAALLKAVYPVIKNPLTGLDPTATVVAGSVGATQDGFFTMNPVTFVKRMLDAGAGPYFDALSFHPYSDQIPFSGTCPTCAPNILTPREQLDAIKALIGLSKTIWISEYGVASTDATSYQQQAAWITDLLDTWQTYSQAGPVFIYTGRDTAGSTDTGAHMGLWTDSGGKKLYTVNGVTYSVSDVLAAWIAAHPQTPNIPVLSPLAALFQSLAAQVQAFVNAIVTAITNFFAGLGGAPAIAASTQTLALRVASVEPTDAESPAAETDASAAATADATATDGKGAAATAVDAATAKTATEATATVETLAAETPAEVTKTETTVPAKTTTTETTTETATGTTGTTTESGTTGTPSGSTTSTGSSTESGSKSDESGDAGKSGNSDGQGKSGKDGDHKDGSGRHARGKDGNGVSVAEVKAKAETVTAGATAGAEGASDSTGGAAS
jgi:hypothetical protein